MTLPSEISLLETAGRLLLVIFFIVAGLSNMTPARIRDHIERMAAGGVPAATPVFWLGIALLLTGWHANIGALCLITFTITATAIFHRFWLLDDPIKRNLGRLFFLNNTAITGGLLLLLANMQMA